MRVLVTGNLGYIGSLLAPMLVSHGHKVIGLDVDLYHNGSFGNAMVEIPTLKKDVRDVDPADLEGFDAICHLAALSNDPLGNLDPNITLEINYAASVRLAELARKAGVRRYIFSSSCSCYGAADDCLLTEEARFNPVTPYARSKVLAERDISAMADDKFSPVFLRNATAYGISPRLRLDLVVNNLVAWAFTTGKIMLESDGSPWRPIVHVEDICRAFLAVLEAPRELVHNRPFNVGLTEDNVQIRDIARAIGDTIANCTVEFAEGACADKRCYKVDCDRLPKLILSYRPEWNLRRGVGQLYTGYKKQALTLSDFEGPKYMRIRQIRYLLEQGILDEKLRFKVLPVD